MHFQNVDGVFDIEINFNYKEFEVEPDYYQPAWSLHRLIAMLPDRDRDWLTEYCDFKDYSKIYDEVISLIEWMIENEYFNKEYLKEE
jgi:hypothetical protein